MQHSPFRTKRLTVVVALLALAVCTGTAQAAGNLLKAIPTINLVCSTATGPGSYSFTLNTVAVIASGKTLNVNMPAMPAGFTISPAGPLTFTPANSTAATGIPVKISMTPAVPGCATANTPAGFTANFTTGTSTNDVALTVTTSNDISTSGLVISPSSVTVMCTLTSGPYTPTVVSVGSTAGTAGTPFVMTTASVAAASWLSVTPVGSTPAVGANSLASASSPPQYTFTTSLTSACGSHSAGYSTTAQVHLTQLPVVGDKLINVTLMVVAAPALTVTPLGATALTYTKGSGLYNHVDVTIGSTPASLGPLPFTVNTAAMPPWLSVDTPGGTTTQTVRFSSTAYADSLAPGLYSTTLPGVLVSSPGYEPTALPITLLISNTASTLSIGGSGAVQNMVWNVGDPIPSAVITLVSSDAPVSYSLVSGGVLKAKFSNGEQEGLAYSFGTQIPVTFDPAVFLGATAGSTLNGTVTVTWGSQASSLVVNFNVRVLAGQATLTSISPASIPTSATPGQTFQISLAGSGFVAGTNLAQVTKVGIVTGGIGSTSMIPDANLSALVISPSLITLVVTVPSPAGADSFLPFTATSPTSVILGVCNPNATTNTCNAATSTQTLTIGSNPIITAVSSASSFVQLTTPNVAPFDLISIFGTNFCPLCGSNGTVAAVPNSLTKVYATTLSGDNGAHTLQVQFNKSDGTLLGYAPILFASNNQINAVVPSTVFAQIGHAAQIVVNYTTAPATTPISSAAYTVNVKATDPGIFTVGADGQGNGAILDPTYALINQNNPAALRNGTHQVSGSPVADSDTIQVYMTGLGVPGDSTATAPGVSDNGGMDNNAGLPAATPWNNNCISVQSYLTSLAGLTGTTVPAIDGAVVLSSLINSAYLPPCPTPTITATIGTVSAPVVYAGWVPDSIAGLYQVNLQLPQNNVAFTDVFNNSAAITQPTQVPIQVTMHDGTTTSQGQVSLWVAPRLRMVPPSGLGASGTAGQAWKVASFSGTDTNLVTATDGTGNYRYIISTGVLPTGLTFTSSNTTAAIAGTPALNTAGSYPITVTAFDSATVPVTGTTSFILVVNGGLSVTCVTGSAATAGIAQPNVETCTASGGVAPYSYTLTGASHAGLAIGPTSGIISTTQNTPVISAGSYTVTAQDANGLSGTSAAFTITVTQGAALTMSNPGTLTGIAGTATTLGTVYASGGSGNITYQLTYTTSGPGSDPLSNGMAISNSGVITTTINTPVFTSTSFTVTATDSTPGTARTGTVQFNISLTQGTLGMTGVILVADAGVSNPSVSTGTALSATTGSGAGAAVQIAHIGGSAPTGGTGGITYTISGSPATYGVAMNTAGIITYNGTADSMTSPVSFTITATDSTTIAPRSGTLPITIQIQ